MSELQPMDLALLVGLGAALLAAAALWWRARGLGVELRRLRQQQQRLQADFSALLGCSRGMGVQLRRQQALARRLGERQSQLEHGDGGAGSARVQAALGLVAGGADSDEIASRCGLSRGEAELLLRLQALQRGEARRAA